MPDVSHIQWARITTGQIPSIQALQDLVDQDAQLISCNGYADGTSVWDAMQQEVENNNAVLASLFQQLTPPGGMEFTCETAQINLRRGNAGDAIRIGADVTAVEGEVVSISPEQYGEGTVTYSVRVRVPGTFRNAQAEIECLITSDTNELPKNSRIDPSQSWSTLTGLINDESIPDAEWSAVMGLSPQRKSELRSFIEFDGEQEWEDLTTNSVLQEGNVACDIYFIGARSSGKSCVLASLLRAIRNSGAMAVAGGLNMNENAGNLYSNYLSRCLDIDCLPQSTATNVALAMSVNVLNNPERADTSTAHTWNFVEMAGERIKVLFENGDLQAINLNGWMTSNNKKVINFVIDPGYRPTAANPYMQDSLMETAHRALKELKVYDNTVHVNILINKWDVVADDNGLRLEDWSEEAIAYARANFSALINSIKQESTEKGFWSTREKFEVHVVPFSIGNDFGFGRYVFNWEDSQESSTNKLLSLLKANTPHG